MLPARDIPVSRSDVMLWIGKWKHISKAKRPPIEDYIRKQIDDLDLPDPMVNTAAHTNLGDQTHVADMIIDDLPSYGVSVSS